MMNEDIKHLLFELTSKPNKNEDDVDAIISILQEKVPLLISGLPFSSQQNIAKNCCLKIYYKDEVIFYQGDEPNSYYIVIYGSVSVYAKSKEQTAYIQYDSSIAAQDERM